MKVGPPENAAVDGPCRPLPPVTEVATEVFQRGSACLVALHIGGGPPEGPLPTTPAGRFGTLTLSRPTCFNEAGSAVPWQLTLFVKGSSGRRKSHLKPGRGEHRKSNSCDADAQTERGTAHSEYLTDAEVAHLMDAAKGIATATATPP